MDRQTLLGFVLIAVVLIIWMTMNAPPPSSQRAADDSVKPSAGSFPQVAVQEQEKKEERPSTKQDALGRFFSPAAAGEEKIFIVETDLYVAEITTRGGLLRKWQLKEYKTWDKIPVQLVEFDKGGDLTLLFTTTDGKLINTRDLFFEANMNNWQHFTLSGNDTVSIDMVLKAAKGGKIIKGWKFINGRYSFDASFTFENMDEVISGFEYQVVWEKGLRYAEHNSVDESNFAAAYAYAGEELAEIDAANADDSVKSNLTGRTDWVATRNKYFAFALLPIGKNADGAYLEGKAERMPDNGLKEKYTVGLKMPFRGSQDNESAFTVYLGPLDFDVIKSYHAGLDQIMSLGAAWIIRPISEWVMIPLFQLLRSFIPNYGVVIIIFSIIIKIGLHPLSKSSMKSMRKMQALQPMMEEIRGKYKDDPQKMNRQVMQLYKDYGVNPAGGCLPLLLQLPILYALWSVFNSAIELRQAGFVLWITDLSIPDVIVRLPFQLPLFGIQEISGLALLMGITMFIQQKMTVKDPRQKMMVWLMPLFLTLLFNSFPSGLNLYYFVFNLLSIGQQVWISKQHGTEPLRKVEDRKRKTGIMSRLTENLPRIQK